MPVGGDDRAKLSGELTICRRRLRKVELACRKLVAESGSGSQFAEELLAIIKEPVSSKAKLARKPKRPKKVAAKRQPKIYGRHVCLHYNKKVVRQWFSWSAFGGKQEALEAADAFFENNLGERSELMALQHMFRKRKTNTTGAVGVSKIEAAPGRSAHYLAYFAEPLSGKRKYKRFSISKYGPDAAKQNAIDWRLEKIEPYWQRYMDLLKRFDLSTDIENPFNCDYE